VTPVVLLLAPRNVARDGPGPPAGDIGVGLAITLGAVVLLLAVIVTLALLSMRRQRQLDALLASGAPRRARVLRLAPEGTTITYRGQRWVGLTLTVEVEGPAPYAATFAQKIAERYIASIQPGAIVDVRVDPARPTRVAFAGIAGKSQI